MSDTDTDTAIEETYVLRTLKFWDSNKVYTHTETVKMQSDLGNPRNCTETDLPDLGENEAAQWNGESWDTVADYRGTVVYSTTDQTQTTWSAVGAIDDGYTETAPPESYPDYYKWDSDSSSWIVNTSKKSEVLAELVEQFNAATQSLILESTVTFSSDAGSITVTCDESTQQNAALQYPLVSEKDYPYTVWDKTESLDLVDADELAEFYKLIMNKPQEIRTERKTTRDTFYDMTTAEIIEQLDALS